MIARIFKSRLFVGVASAATAIALIGGVAYAVTVVQPSSSDKYYACFSNTDYLKGKIYLNMAPPTCPAVTDVVRSWDAVKGAVGATGPSGSNGVAGATGPSGATGSGGDSYRPINLCSSIPGPMMNFSACTLTNSNWGYQNLAGTLFNGTRFESSTLSSADLTGAALRGAEIVDASDFSRADLTDVNAEDLKVALSDFSYAVFKGANLRGAIFSGVNVSYMDLSGADLTGAYFYSYGGVSTTGQGTMTYFRTTCPDGFYTGLFSTCAGHGGGL